MSLGIGANVVAKHLYIPDLNKVDEGGFGPLDTSSLIQLVNRAGRDAIGVPYANVYCQLRDFKRTEDMFNADPSVATEELPFEEIRKKLNANQYNHYLWRKILGG